MAVLQQKHGPTCSSLFFAMLARNICGRRHGRQGLDLVWEYKVGLLMILLDFMHLEVLAPLPPLYWEVDLH